MGCCAKRRPEGPPSPPGVSRQLPEGVDERVLLDEIEKCGDDLLCGKSRQQALLSDAFIPPLHLFTRDHCKVLARIFQSVSQEVVRGNLVLEDRIRQQRLFQVIGNTDEVL